MQLQRNAPIHPFDVRSPIVIRAALSRLPGRLHKRGRAEREAQSAREG